VSQRLFHYGSTQFSSMSQMWCLCCVSLQHAAILVHLIVIISTIVPRGLTTQTPHSHYPGLLTARDNPGYWTRVSLCSHLQIHPEMRHAIMHQNKHPIYNFVNLVLSTNWSHAEVETTESEATTDQPKEALQYHGTGVFAHGCFLARNRHGTKHVEFAQVCSCACECAGMQVSEATEAYAFVMKPVKFKSFCQWI